MTEWTVEEMIPYQKVDEVIMGEVGILKKCWLKKKLNEKLHTHRSKVLGWMEQFSTWIEIYHPKRENEFSPRKMSASSKG